MKVRLLGTIGLVALVAAIVAAAGSAAPRDRLFQFRGELLAASSTSLQLQVEAGNPFGLRVMLGQSQDQTFTLGPQTEVLLWQGGVPHVASIADLKQGDWLTVNVRAERGSTLAEVEATTAGLVGDQGSRPNRPTQPLYLFVGTVAGPQAGGKLTLTVTDGNHRALRLMIAQPAAETFTYNTGTIFLLWQGKVPTVIDPSQLKAGDRITVRIRAPFASTLAQIEATPAAHVGDHEPGDPDTQN